MYNNVQQCTNNIPPGNLIAECGGGPRMESKITARQEGAEKRSELFDSEGLINGGDRHKWSDRT
jgi:hypothetical protein